MLRATTERAWPTNGLAYYGQLTGNLDLVSKPIAPRLPTVIVGMAGQLMINARIYDPIARCRSYQLAAESIEDLLTS